MSNPPAPAATGSAPPWLFPAVALAAILTRLIFVWAAPAMEGDGTTYMTVALNIFHNGCVSMSDPSTGACAPHWGGNQLPGYPTFIALSWLLTGEWAKAPLVAQTVAFGFAAAYLIRALALAGTNARALSLAAAVLVLSPTMIAWPRMLLTETLALAAALWVLAAIIRSVSESRIRIFELGVIFAIGLFIRYDFLMLAVPVAITGFYLHRPAEALRRGAIIAVMIAIPYGAWTLRSVAADLPPLPPFGLTNSGEPLASGPLDWMETWVASPYDLPISVWPLVTGDYENIQPPDRAFTDPGERDAVTALLDQLRQSKNSVVPSQVDTAFADLADTKRRAQPLYQWIGLPLRRAAEMWFSPLPSMGWPGEIGSGRVALLEAVRAGNVGEVANFAKQNIGPVVAKSVVGGWRWLVLAGIGFVLVANVLGRRQDGLLIWLALAYALVRTVVFASTVLVEARYLLPVLAWLEISLVLALAQGKILSMDGQKSGPSRPTK